VSVDGARYALIVANDEYDHPKLKPLRAPAKDAAELARVLGDPAIGGFEVAVSRNEPHHQLMERVGEFFAECDPKDTLLVHFSCHGIKDEWGRLFFASPNTKYEHPSYTAMQSEWFRERMEESRSQRIVVLLDCCYSGAFLEGSTARGDDPVNPIGDLKGPGRAIITATNSTESAWEDTKATADTPSYFTSALVRGIETGEADSDNDHSVGVEELFKYVRAALRERGVPQTPKRSNDADDDLIIAFNRNVIPRPLPDDLVRRLRDDNPTEFRRTAVQDLRQIARRSDGVALTARETLAQLARDDDSLKVRQDAKDALTDLPAQSAAPPWLKGAPAAPPPLRAQPAPPAPAQPPAPPPPPPRPEPAVELASLRHDDAVIGLDVVGHAVSGRSPVVVTASRDHTARLWAEDDERIKLPHDDWVLAVAANTEGTVLATTCRDRVTRLWDLTAAREIQRFPHDDMVWAVAMDPRGRWVATAGGDAIARLWNLGTGTADFELKHDGPLARLAFDGAGERIATIARPGAIHVWELTNGQEVARFDGAEVLLDVAFDAAGEVFGASAGDRDIAAVWSVQAGRQVATLGDAGRLLAASFGDGGKLLATVGMDHRARIWDTASGQELATLPGDRWLQAVAIDVTGRYVACAAQDHTARIWDGGRAWLRGRDQ
jgi:hypothetical protein